MKSLDPATRTFGLWASMATAGSFWWFRGVSPDGLPTLTLLAVATVWAAAGRTPPRTTAIRETHTATLRRLTGRARHMSASLPRRRGTTDPSTQRDESSRGAV